MKIKHYKYLVMQLTIVLAIFFTFIFLLVRYQQLERAHQLSGTAQSISYSLQQHISITKGILISLTYNYGIDDSLNKEKFDLLVRGYMRENPNILYIQHKNSDTVTDMVYPAEYEYTLGASLRGRPEVESSVNKAIANGHITANDPFVLKSVEGQPLGLIIRCPLYRDNRFDGFFVVVFDVKDYISNVMDEVLPEGYHVSLYDRAGNLIWGGEGRQGREVFQSRIPIVDNYWNMYLTRDAGARGTGERFLFLAVVAVFLLMGLLFFLQASIFRRDRNIQHLSTLHRELERLKESYTLALSSANDALWEWDLTTGVIITSDKWIDITGNALVGQGLGAILQEESVHREDYSRALALFSQCLSGSLSEFCGEYRIKNKDNRYTWVQNRGKVYFDGAGSPVKIAGAVSSIEERKQREAKMEHMAYYDALTGLPNRAQFMDALERALEKAGASPAQYSILMIDLDNFKLHNDLLGPAFCDQLLMQVGDRLSRVLGGEDMVARFGGDEFLILSRTHGSVAEATALCRKLLSLFSPPFVLLRNMVYLSVSIGVVHSLESCQTANDALRSADTALNRAKENGKNQFCVYDAQMHADLVRKSAVESCIREGLTGNAFTLHYQLQQCLSTGQVRGVEALARLFSERLGSVPPLEFISVAEYTGLIVPLGNWIFKNACVQGRAWLDRGCRIGMLSVNISVHQLRNEGFYGFVRKTLEETGFPAGLLELEITESVLLDFSTDNFGILSKLKLLGLRIALDDFGTGYSSLNYLTSLPIDTLKIDKSFLARSLRGAAENQVIRSIIELAHALHMTVVCEGVETEAQRAALVDMGCDYIQGYYFARPADAGTVEARFEL